MEIGDKTLGLRPSGKQLGRGVLSFLITLAIVLVLAKAMHGRVPILARQIIGAGVVAAAYLLFSRWIERWHPPELNARGAIAEFAVGLAIGLGLFSAVMATLWILGIYHPTTLGNTCRPAQRSPVRSLRGRSRRNHFSRIPLSPALHGDGNMDCPAGNFCAVRRCACCKPWSYPLQLDCNCARSRSTSSRCLRSYRAPLDADCITLWLELCREHAVRNVCLRRSANARPQRWNSKWAHNPDRRSVRTRGFPRVRLVVLRGRSGASVARGTVEPYPTSDVEGRGPPDPDCGLKNSQRGHSPLHQQEIKSEQNQEHSVHS